jgi:hypothetical protein
MNIAIYGSLPASACTLGTEGSHGPDRLTRLYYDAVGRHTKTLAGYQTADEAYEVQKNYSENGHLQYLFDGRAQPHHLRLRWPRPAVADPLPGHHPGREQPHFQL